MPLPEGIPPELVWILLWIALSLALLAALGSLPSADTYRSVVSERTEERLPRVNDHLQAQIERQWNKNPSVYLVPDVAALRKLKHTVDFAMSSDLMLARRTARADFGRAVLTVQIGLAFASGLGLSIGYPNRSVVIMLATVLAALGFATTLWCLAMVAIIGAQLGRGSHE